MASILRNKETGLYLAGWDLFGKPKYISDKGMADSMRFAVAAKVKDTLENKMFEGEFELITQKG